MPSLRTCLAIALLGLCLGASLTQAADSAQSAEIKRKLDTLAERQLPEAELLAVKQTLEKTLSLLAERAASEQRLRDLKEQLEQAPRLIGEAQRELNRLKASQPTQVTQRYADTQVPQLEQMLAERTSQLSDWQKQLGDANRLTLTAQTRPERVGSDCEIAA